MDIKSNRKISFIYVALVYIFATVCGFFAYRYLPLSAIWLKILLADIIATTVVFFFSVLVDNASVYDPYWSVQPIVILAFLCVKAPLTPIRALILIAVLFWGVRLTVNWAYTFTNLKHQDWRYTMLKEKTGRLYPLVNYFGIHMFPTIVVYLCILPAIHAFIYPLTANAFTVIPFALSIFASVLQGVADIQMHRYRKTKTSPFIRDGLWKYSRHPNYLGEILMWWGIAFITFSANVNLWYLFGGALINTLMFLVVSIPMADKRQSKKQGFSEYKRATRMLLPIKK